MNGSPGEIGAAEWRNFWPLVVAATAGFSMHSISTTSIGLFMEPISAEFGWGRAQVSTATLVPAVFMVLLSPFAGGVIDRWGSRWLAIASLALTGISLAMIGLANGSAAQWVWLWAFYGFVSIGIKATVWAAAVCAAFEASRGLALGVCMCGSAISQIVVPPLTQWLVDDFGWRAAYAWMGLGWAAPCILLALFFLRPPVRRAATTVADPDPPRAEGGLGFAEALRDTALLRIGLSTFLTMFIGAAILVHQIPILTGIGLSRHDAAWLASLAGAASIAGKLVTGWLVDRYDASLVGTVTLTVPAVAFVTLLQPGLPATMVVTAMMIVGFTSGSKLQICAYLTGRYGGMRNYGKIFGVMTSIVGIAGGLGSVAAGAVFDAYGHYAPLLIAGIATSVICGLLIARLGPYPTWKASEAEISQADKEERRLKF